MVLKGDRGDLGYKKVKKMNEKNAKNGGADGVWAVLGGLRNGNWKAWKNRFGRNEWDEQKGR